MQQSSKHELSNALSNKSTMISLLSYFDVLVNGSAVNVLITLYFLMLFQNNTKVNLSFVSMFAAIQMIGQFNIRGIPTDSWYPQKGHLNLVFKLMWTFKNGGRKFSLKQQEARLSPRYTIQVSVSKPPKNIFIFIDMFFIHPWRISLFLSTTVLFMA